MKTFNKYIQESHKFLVKQHTTNSEQIYIILLYFRVIENSKLCNKFPNNYIYNNNYVFYGNKSIAVSIIETLLEYWKRVNSGYNLNIGYDLYSDDVEIYTLPNNISITKLKEYANNLKNIRNICNKLSESELIFFRKK